MFIYISLLGNLFILYLTSLVSKRKAHRALVFTFSILLITVAGLRYDVGVDYKLYYSVVTNPSGFEYERLELMHKLIINFIQRLGLSPQFYFFVNSLLYILGYLRFNNKYSVYPVLSFFIFVTLPLLYLASFNLVRQFAAMTFFLLSIDFLIKRNFFVYSILILIASLFHKSAIIFLVFYFFIHNTKITLWLLVFLALFIKSVLYFLLNANILPGIYIYGFLNKKISVFKIVFLAVPLIIFYFCRSLNRSLFDINNQKIYNISMNFLIVSVYMYALPKILNVPEEFFIRYAFYFNNFLPILIALLIFNIRNKYFRVLAIIGVMIIFASYYIHILLAKGHQYKLVPYKSVLI